LEEKGRKDRGSGEIISTGQRAQFPAVAQRKEGRKEGRKCVRDIVEEMYGGPSCKVWNLQAGWAGGLPAERTRGIYG